MEKIHETYTYTARNANHPSEVVTFTLDNNHLRVNLTGVLDQAGTIAEAEQKSSEIRNQISTQAKPAVMKIIESFSGPTHISDVDARLDGEQLKVILWQRAAGLRLAPVQFNMKKIDNVEAAEAFVDELDQRKKKGPSESRLWGPLDYWAGWITFLLAVGFFFRWIRRRDKV